jgi:hypothetical protein
MLAPSKPERKVDERTNILFLFSFFLIISIFSSVIFYSMSPALATGYGKKLSIVLINGDKIYVRSGSYHIFLQGYQLYVKGTDTEGKKVWIELRREGTPLKNDIVTEGSHFVYSNDVIEVLNLTVSTVYAGADGVLVKFSPVYQHLDPKLPIPQTLEGSLSNSSDNKFSESRGLETQVEGFDMPLFLLGLGFVLLITGFFAGKR